MTWTEQFAFQRLALTYATWYVFLEEHEERIVKSRWDNLWLRLRVKVGATLVEYTFIIAIVSIIGTVLLVAIGKNTNKLLESTNSNIPQ